MSTMSVGFIRTVVAEALRASSADFVGEQQPDARQVTVEALQVQRQLDRRPGKGDLEAWDFGCHEIGGHRDVLPWTACIGGDQHVNGSAVRGRRAAA